ncbi:hypothetical protein SprV_0501998200 [Sparganum proliferum]
MLGAAKAEREARKSQLRPHRNANAQSDSACPRYRRTFRVPIGLVGHLHANRSIRTTPAAASSSNSASSSMLTNDIDRTPDPLLPSSSLSFFVFVFLLFFSSFFSPPPLSQPLLRGPPACRANVWSTNLQSPHSPPLYTLPREFTHRIGLFGHMHIHESGIDRLTQSTPRRPAHPPPSAPPSSVHLANSPCLAQPTPSLPPRPPSAAPPLLPSPKPTLTSSNSPADTVPVHSYHASAWSVTCEFISRILVNQFLEHQLEPAALASTVHTALSHSCAA